MKIENFAELRSLESRCEMPVAAGGGSVAMNRWYYNGNTRECSPFQYRGLYGNANNFLTKEECEQACPSMFFEKAQFFQVEKFLKKFSAFTNPCSSGQPFLVGNKPQWCGPNSSPCPATYWCHTGPSVETTMCCPQGKLNTLSSYLTKSEIRYFSSKSVRDPIHVRNRQRPTHTILFRFLHSVLPTIPVSRFTRKSE